MPIFTFIRTVQYTETVEVSANSWDEAVALEEEGADGDHNNDEVVIETKKVYKWPSNKP